MTCLAVEAPYRRHSIQYRSHLATYCTAHNTVCSTACSTVCSTARSFGFHLLAPQQRNCHDAVSHDSQHCLCVGAAVHVCAQEKFYFNPGDTGFRVFDTRYGRLGMAICWDQW